MNFLNLVRFFQFLKGRCHGNQFCGKIVAKLLTPLYLSLCRSETEWNIVGSLLKLNTDEASYVKVGEGDYVVGIGMST